jgi:hypothetical protein
MKISLENVAGKSNQIQFLYLRIKLMPSLQREKGTPMGNSDSDLLS